MCSYTRRCISSIKILEKCRLTFHLRLKYPNVLQLHGVVRKLSPQPQRCCLRPTITSRDNSSVVSSCIDAVSILLIVIPTHFLMLSLLDVIQSRSMNPSVPMCPRLSPRSSGPRCDCTVHSSDHPISQDNWLVIMRNSFSFEELDPRNGLQRNFHQNVSTKFSPISSSVAHRHSGIAGRIPLPKRELMG